MAKETGKELNELKSKIQEEKVIVGADSVLKNLKVGKLSQVFLASNCPEKIRVDVERYASLSNTPVTELELNNEELGVFCKKNYMVAILGII